MMNIEGRFNFEHFEVVFFENSPHGFFIEKIGMFYVNDGASFTHQPIWKSSFVVVEKKDYSVFFEDLKTSFQKRVWIWYMVKGLETADDIKVVFFKLFGFENINGNSFSDLRFSLRYRFFPRFNPIYVVSLFCRLFQKEPISAA